MSSLIAVHPMMQLFRVILPRLLFLSLTLGTAARGEGDWS